MSPFFVYYFFMQKQIEAFLKLNRIFKDNGYSLYLVGGTVRDFLLKLPLTDLDVTTDATPSDIKKFFTGDASYNFEKFGAVTIHFENQRFDLTTLRKEKGYFDSRHPTKITFVKETKKDYKRRDFTINGMYLDERFNLIDYCNGKNDLDKKIIKTIGNPYKRLKEDPLRIIRAIRFALAFSFAIDEKLKKAIHKRKCLLDKLNKDKIKQDLLKIKNCDENIKISLFNEFGILYLLDMVK